MTESSKTPGFPAACRRFLAVLPDWIDEAPSALPAHARRCERCRGRLAAARAQALALRGCPRPPLPAELRGEAFLGGVYERVNAAAETSLGAALRAGLGPVATPADAVWVEVAERADVASSLRRGLPALRAPGWLWPRIRARIAGGPPRERARPAARVGLAAAALLVSGVLAMLMHEAGRGPADAVADGFEVTLERRSEPFDASFSLDGVFYPR